MGVSKRSRLYQTDASLRDVESSSERWKAAGVREWDLQHGLEAFVLTEAKVCSGGPAACGLVSWQWGP